jgi:hypothetical protein
MMSSLQREEWYYLHVLTSRGRCQALRDGFEKNTRIDLEVGTQMEFLTNLLNENNDDT